MSWWARKISQTLRLDDDEEEEEEDHQLHNRSPTDPNSAAADDDHRGVKEDLSELSKTLSRQFWGVASLLAPLPTDQTPNDAAGPSDAAAGIRSDLAEIGGKFRSGISKLSDNIVKTDFSKIASELLQLGVVEEGDGVAVGVTEEVVMFARDIAMHPETWLDFPLPCDDDEDDEEFEMSDAQQEHALAVERLAPRLAARRMELCPGYMSESFFWMIYFVLLHPRLNKHDAELLSTPEIVKARALFARENNQPIRESYYSGETSVSVPANAQFESIPLEALPTEPNSSSLNDKYSTDKHLILSNEVPTVDKSVIEEQPIGKSFASLYKEDQNSEDEADDWLKEESSNIPIENDEDVSFSDLEEEDGDASTSYKKAAYGSDSSTRESRDWVQLGRNSNFSTKDMNSVVPDQVSAPGSESKESSDWLDLEEIDVE